MRCLKFDLLVPTPIEFICHMISMLASKVSCLELETMLLLRGEACSLSYICAHFSEIQMYRASSIATACIIHTMECWKWDTVSARFVEIIAASIQPEI
jgi:hypothetical protein